MFNFQNTHLGFDDIQTRVFICAFHRIQAWDRWLRKRKCLTSEERTTLEKMLREVADQHTTLGYQLKLDNLKKHSAYHKIQQYLERHWFSCEQRWVKALQDKDFQSGKKTE